MIPRVGKELGTTGVGALETEISAARDGLLNLQGRGMEQGGQDMEFHAQPSDLFPDLGGGSARCIPFRLHVDMNGQNLVVNRRFLLPMEQNRQ